MSYVEDIQRAIDFMEENLRVEITAEDVARRVSYSVFHFHRIFESVMGCSVSSYLRKRRLTHAAYELNETAKRVIDIGQEYGFESQAAFTRSFQQQFGITPGRYRKTKPYLAWLGKQDVADILARNTNFSVGMTPDIVYRDSFTVLGLEQSGLQIAQSPNVDVNQDSIPQLWNVFLKRLREMEAADDFVAYGVCMPTGGGVHFAYLAGIETTAKPAVVPHGMLVRDIPGGHYAVFVHRGPARLIGSTARYIYGIWLPKSRYTLRVGPELEVYSADYLGPNQDNSEMQIWIPITDRKNYQNHMC